MPNRPVIAFAPLVFERDDFLVLTLFQNFGSDLRAGDKRASVSHVFSVSKHHHIAKRRGLTRLDIQKIDIDRIAFRDAELPATSLDNCVSHKMLEGKKPPNVPQMGPFDKGKACSLRDAGTGSYAAALAAASTSSLYKLS